jgi:hypothetical protein
MIIHCTMLMCGIGLISQGQGRGCGMQDPPEYYNPPGGLLAFDLQLEDLVNSSVPANGGKDLEDYSGHFKLINYQLTQVHQALTRVPAPPCGCRALGTCAAELARAGMSSQGDLCHGKRLSLGVACRWADTQRDGGGKRFGKGACATGAVVWGRPLVGAPQRNHPRLRPRAALPVPPGPRP